MSKEKQRGDRRRVRQECAGDALALSQLPVEPEEGERYQELARRHGDKHRNARHPPASCQQNVGRRAQDRQRSEIDLYRVERKHPRRRDAQRHANDEVPLVDQCDSVEIEDQAKKEVENARVHEIHDLKRRDDVESGGVREARQQRQQRSRLRVFRPVVDAIGDHVGVLATVPAKAVVGVNTTCSCVETGKECQADCGNHQVRRPTPIELVSLGNHFGAAPVVGCGQASSRDSIRAVTSLSRRGCLLLGAKRRDRPLKAASV